MSHDDPRYAVKLSIREGLDGVPDDLVFLKEISLTYPHFCALRQWLALNGEVEAAKNLAQMNRFAIFPEGHQRAFEKLVAAKLDYVEEISNMRGSGAGQPLYVKPQGNAPAVKPGIKKPNP